MSDGFKPKFNVNRSSDAFKAYSGGHAESKSGEKDENVFSRIRFEGESENGGKRRAEEIEEKLEAARSISYSEGYAAGKEDGLAIERKRLASLLDNLGNALSELTETREQLYRGFEQNCVDLAFAIAEKVIRREIDADRSIVVQAVAEALDIVKNYRTVKIRLHPEDVDLVRESESLIQEMIEKGTEITVTGDGEIEKGGCVIETDFGIVDARMGSRLQVVEEALEGLLP